MAAVTRRHQPVAVRGAFAHDLAKRRCYCGVAHCDGGHAAQSVAETSPVFLEHAISEKVDGDANDVIAVPGFPSHAPSPLIVGKSAKIRVEHTSGL